jgi:hypothetical protein
VPIVILLPGTSIRIDDRDIDFEVVVDSSSSGVAKQNEKAFRRA